jgi:hypothetical protein
MAVSNLDDFQALDPFFRIIEEGVAGLVDGEHFFDLLAEDVVFEYIITVPGYPRRVAGRQPWPSYIGPMAPRSFSIVATTWPFITTRSPELSFSSTPRRAESSRPGLPTATATSRCYRSSTARSLTGAITSIRSRSLTQSAGPPRPQTATDLVALTA